MTKVIVTTQDELESLIQSSVRKALNEQAVKPEASKIEFLNLKEAAKFLNLAPQTIYGLTSKRDIPFLKRGKKLYFKKSELENWINEGKHQSIAEIKKEINLGKP
ncbi:MAG TPA: helix-turn-helix domain-containing protein [Bacteroidia bacterium]|jgi:excisionase family DNA binding protein|nr:helix-turn-helix domain-containing protein [Bacteroidia bacterium]